MKVILSGGGTAGHINPALAIGGYFKENMDAELLYIGTKKGLESTLVPKAGFPIRYIRVRGLIRRLTLENFMVIKDFLSAISTCKKILREFSPDLVIGTGGYVCAPVLYAAHALKIPTLIHEQNVIPGVTVKLAASHADQIAISFPDTKAYLKPRYLKKCILTGNPIREELFFVDKEAAKAALGLDGRPFVAVFGGSLGAKRINDAMVSIFNQKEIEDYQFLLGTGQRYFDEVTSTVTKKSDAFTIVPYINNMDQVMAAADLVIGRSGALTISELAALGKPSILIPSPNVAHDHQTLNAQSMEKAGASIMLRDSILDGDTLYDAISSVLSDLQKREDMAKAAERLGIKDATKRICDAACQLMKK